MRDRFEILEDSAAYHRLVAAFLEYDPVVHTLPLPVLHQVLAGWCPPRAVPRNRFVS